MHHFSLSRTLRTLYGAMVFACILAFAVHCKSKPPQDATGGGPGSSNSVASSNCLKITDTGSETGTSATPSPVATTTGGSATPTSTTDGTSTTSTACLPTGTTTPAPTGTMDGSTTPTPTDVASTATTTPTPEGTAVTAGCTPNTDYSGVMKASNLAGCNAQGKLLNRITGTCLTATTTTAYQCNQASIVAAFGTAGVVAQSTITAALAEGFFLDQCGMESGKPYVILVKQENTAACVPKITVRTVNTR